MEKKKKSMNISSELKQIKRISVTYEYDIFIYFFLLYFHFEFIQEIKLEILSLVEFFGCYCCFSFWKSHNLQIR